MRDDEPQDRQEKAPTTSGGGDPDEHQHSHASERGSSNDLNSRSAGRYDPRDPLGVLNLNPIDGPHLLDADQHFASVFGAISGDVASASSGRLSKYEAFHLLTSGELSLKDSVTHKVVDAALSVGAGALVGAGVLVIGGPFALPEAIDAALGAARLTSVTLEVTGLWDDMKTRTAGAITLLDAYFPNTGVNSSAQPGPTPEHFVMPHDGEACSLPHRDPIGVIP